MKLTELYVNQSLIVQLCWGVRKIEFYSNVIESDNEAVYVTPYLHKDSPLEINVTMESGVVCNIFTDEPVTNKRISWKSIELTTVVRGGQKVYCLRTHSFNIASTNDDRRYNERIIVGAKAMLFDGVTDGGISVTVHDISTLGVSFYAAKDYIARSQQVVIEFTDHIDEKPFDIRLECNITRVTNDGEYNIIGCKIIGESKDYKIYEFLKRLRHKNHNKLKLANAEAENIVDAKGEADKDIEESENSAAADNSQTTNSQTEDSPIKDSRADDSKIKDTDSENSAQEGADIEDSDKKDSDKENPDKDGAEASETENKQNTDKKIK